MCYTWLSCAYKFCVQNSHLSPLYRPWSACPSFSSPANSGPSMSVLYFSFVLFCLSFSCPSDSSPSFTSLSISTLATSSVIFQSCIIHSCDLVHQLAVRHFLNLRLRPSFASPAFFSPANSAHPTQCTIYIMLGMLKPGKFESQVLNWISWYLFGFDPNH